MALYYKDALKAVSNRTVFVFQPPDLITSFEPVFSECIKHANPRVGNGLARILSRLQVQRARCIDLVNDINESANHGNDVSTQVNRHLVEQKVLTVMHSLIELRALIDRMFPFARADRDFNLDIGRDMNIYMPNDYVTNEEKQDQDELGINFKYSKIVEG